MKAGKWIGIGAIAGALTLGASAAAAPGDTVYEGETPEGATVKLTVGTAGNATKFKLGKTEVECDEGGTLSNKPGTYTDFHHSDPGDFKISDKSKSSSGGFDFKTKSKITGTAGNDLSRWSGNVKLATKVFENGEQIDLCKLKTTWEAS